MSWTQIDHTADIGLDLRAPTLEELLVEAARGFCDSITDLQAVRASEERTFELTATDHEELLICWLEELHFAFESDHFLPSRVEVELDGSGERIRLHASVHGEPYDPDRHPLKVAIKAVTYHQLQVVETDDDWQARVIFDI